MEPVGGSTNWLEEQVRYYRHRAAEYDATAPQPGDPRKEHEAVALEALHRMRLGMTTYVEGPGLSRRITATLDHVVPVVGVSESPGVDRLTVILVPTEADRATVSTLVPGLRFQAKMDTNTAPQGVPAVNTE